MFKNPPSTPNDPPRSVISVRSISSSRSQWPRHLSFRQIYRVPYPWMDAGSLCAGTMTNPGDVNSGEEADRSWGICRQLLNVTSVNAGLKTCPGIQVSFVWCNPAGMGRGPSRDYKRIYFGIKESREIVTPTKASTIISPSMEKEPHRT